MLVANPSADVYGSDLQLVESVAAMTERGWRVLVAVPADGPLVSLVTDRGAQVHYVEHPVLRRSFASPIGMARLAAQAARAVVHLRGVIRWLTPDVVYVNTVTLPWWLAAARLTRTPSLCHVHEAEINDRRAVRLALSAPLALADVVVPNGRAALEAMCEAVPRLRHKARVVFNGVDGPDHPLTARRRDDRARLVVVGRLSPRKATDVALEAVARLRSEGRDVHLDVCGTAFAGYEWFVDQLHERASRTDLAGSVTFSGYVSPIWPALEVAQAMLAPSLGESLGNAVVQALLMERPVVATAVQGHLDSVTDGETGLLVPPGDAVALAEGIARLLDDPELADRLAAAGRRHAIERFGVPRYRAEIVDVVASLTEPGRRTRR